jgi:aspartyl-tRNA(Asn)/glutamyl-tRNA(Gln) amidotransferase subunit A
MECLKFQKYYERRLTMEIYNLTAYEIKKLLDKKEISISEVTESYLKRIKEKEKDIEAFTTICEEEARENAKRIEEGIKKGEITSAFAGIPIGIKDNISTKGIATTCSSRMLENYIPPYDATVIEKVKSENLNIMGKLNLDEFAMGISTETSYFKKTKNPHNIKKSPGGSSGGSAAAVASRNGTMGFR